MPRLIRNGDLSDEGMAFIGLVVIVAILVVINAMHGSFG